MKEEESGLQPKEEENSDIASSLLSNSEINIPIAKTDSEFQRYIVDIDSLTYAFYEAFAGYKKVRIQEKTQIVGMEKIEEKEVYVQDKNVALLNESGASFLKSSIYGLISHIATTGKLTEDFILHLWDSKLRSIEFTLLDNYYFQGNTFGIRDVSVIPEIITTLASLSTITFKAIDGFTLQQLTETIITALRKEENLQPQKKEGFFGKIGKSLSNII